MGKRRETKGDDPYQEEYDLIMSQVDDLNKVGWQLPTIAAAVCNRSSQNIRQADCCHASSAVHVDNVCRCLFDRTPVLLFCCRSKLRRLLQRRTGLLWQHAMQTSGAQAGHSFVALQRRRSSGMVQCKQLNSDWLMQGQYA